MNTLSLKNYLLHDIANGYWQKSFKIQEILKQEYHIAIIVFFQELFKRETIEKKVVYLFLRETKNGRVENNNQTC